MHRSDIFSSGRCSTRCSPAAGVHRATAAETMAAILKEDPPHPFGHQRDAGARAHRVALSREDTRGAASVRTRPGLRPRDAGGHDGWTARPPLPAQAKPGMAARRYGAGLGAASPAGCSGARQHGAHAQCAVSSSDRFCRDGGVARDFAGPQGRRVRGPSRRASVRSGNDCWPVAHPAKSRVTMSTTSSRAGRRIRVPSSTTCRRPHQGSTA